MKPITGRFVAIATCAFFGTVVAVNLVMMRYAISTMPGVEVDSAYVAGLAFNRDIADAHRQDERRWRVDARLERKRDGSATLVMEMRDSEAKPVSGLSVNCRLQRPADRRADLALALEDKGGGIYRGALPAIAAGQWDLLIEGRATEQVVFMSRNRVTLGDG